MNNYQIQRSLADLYNDSNIDMMAEFTKFSSTPIIENPSDYTVQVEYSEVNLSNMCLDPSPRYQILIDNNLKNIDLPYGYNLFTFDQPLYKISEIVNWFHSVFDKKALPYNLGMIYLGPNEKFVRKVSQQVHDDSFANGNFKIYVNQRLAKLLEGFTDPVIFDYQGEAFHELYVSVTTGAGEEQPNYTLMHVLKAKRIHFYTDLPVTSTFCSTVDQGVVVPKRLLNTVSIDTANYDVTSKTNIIYTPSLERHTTMTGTGVIQQFTVYVSIYYANGTEIRHTLKPEDYCSIKLSFNPRVLSL